MSSKTLIILASHRQESNTEKFVKEIYGENPYQVINLLNHHIQPYSYSGEYSGDDGFMNVIATMQEYADYVLAPPYTGTA
jgi:hypothetical protein